MRVEIEAFSGKNGLREGEREGCSRAKILYVLFCSNPICIHVKTFSHRIMYRKIVFEYKSCCTANREMKLRKGLCDDEARVCYVDERLCLCCRESFVYKFKFDENYRVNCR